MSSTQNFDIQTSENSSTDADIQIPKLNLIIPETPKSAPISTPVSVPSSNNKKRKLNDLDEETIKRYLLPIHVLDYYPMDKKADKEIFDDVDSFHLWMARNSKNRLKHNRAGDYVDSKCRNLVTKRYLYFRLDQVTEKLEKEINEYRNDIKLYKNDVQYYKNKLSDGKIYTSHLEKEIDNLKKQLKFNVEKEKEDINKNLKAIVDYNQNLLAQTYLTQNMFPFQYNNNNNKLLEQLFFNQNQNQN